MAHRLLEQRAVIEPILAPIRDAQPTSFWARVLRDESLQSCENLEKLLIGCEMIAALDDLELLAA